MLTLRSGPLLSVDRARLGGGVRRSFRQWLTPSETSEPHFEPRATRLRRLLREDLVRIDPGRAPSRSSFQRQLGAGRFPIAVALPFDPVALWLLTLPKVPPLVLPSPRLSVAVRLLA